jgi:hypothetical protein
MSEKEGNLPPFVIKTFRLMSDTTVHPYANWSDDGKSFTVYNPSEFASTVLPKYFKHNNFCSFVRQLNIYGFHKIHPEQWTFKHENDYFIRGEESALKHITRRKQVKRALESDESEPPKKIQNVSTSGFSTPTSVMSPPIHIVDTDVTRFKNENSILKGENDMLKTEHGNLAHELANERLMNKQRFETLEGVILQLIQQQQRLQKELSTVKGMLKTLTVDGTYKKLEEQVSGHVAKDGFLAQAVHAMESPSVFPVQHSPMPSPMPKYEDNANTNIYAQILGTPQTPQTPVSQMFFNNNYVDENKVQQHHHHDLQLQQQQQDDLPLEFNFDDNGMFSATNMPM